MRVLSLGTALSLCIGSLLGQQPTWFTNPVNGHQYALTPPLGWAQAEAHAVANGAHLVTIRSSGEEVWLYYTFGLIGTWWIGFSDAAQEGTWTWTSGEVVTFTHWASGEPNNAGNEDFANLLSGIGGWNDVEDTIQIPGIMEIATPLASYVAFGGGCPGSVGVPLLAPVGSEVPRLGTTSHLRISNIAPVVHVVLVVIGFSTTMNTSPLGTYPLPFDLGQFGLPGCQQLVSADFTHFLLALTGQVDWPLSVPVNPGLVGATLHVQALSHESQLIASVSNGVTATVGY